jgi:hypothetical protein
MGAFVKLMNAFMKLMNRFMRLVIAFMKLMNRFMRLVIVFMKLMNRFMRLVIVFMKLMKRFMRLVIVFMKLMNAFMKPRTASSAFMRQFPEPFQPLTRNRKKIVRRSPAPDPLLFEGWMQESTRRKRWPKLAFPGNEPGGPATDGRAERKANAMSNSNGSAGVGAKAAAPKGLELELTLFQQGVEKSLPAAGMPVAGTMVTQAKLDTEMTTDLALYQAVDDARTQLKNAQAALKAQVPTIKARYAVLKLATQNNFGAANPVLATFGIKPTAPRKKATSAENALAAAKRQATRDARKTMGAKQKASIVGATPTVTIGPSGTTVTPAGQSNTGQAAQAPAGTIPSVTAVPAPGSTTPSAG